jgi:hypothetical protein
VALLVRFLTRRLRYPASATAQSPGSAIGLMNGVVPARLPTPVPIAGTTPPGAKLYISTAHALTNQARNSVPETNLQLACAGLGWISWGMGGRGGGCPAGGLAWGVSAAGRTRGGETAARNATTDCRGPVALRRGPRNDTTTGGRRRQARRPTLPAHSPPVRHPAFRATALPVGHGKRCSKQWLGRELTRAPQGRAQPKVPTQVATELNHVLHSGWGGN